jgi:hypothetical protein
MTEDTESYEILTRRISQTGEDKMRLKGIPVWGLVLSILFLSGAVSASQNQLKGGEVVSDYFSSLNQPYDSYLRIEEVSPSWAQGKYLTEEPQGEAEDIYAFKPKNTKLAFFYSLLIPGAGEFYAGSKIKPLLFLGLEASLWTGHFIYQGKGNDKEDEYKAYADLHWNPDVYLAWWNSLDSADQARYSHTLPVDEQSNPIRNHEYYENIGKYNQFSIGWDDCSQANATPTANRNFYLDVRDESNRMFSRARTFTVCVLVNHVLSSFDAALTARQYNKRQERFAGIKLEMKMREYRNESIPQLTLTKSFY